MIDRDDSFDRQALAREAFSWVCRLRSGEMTSEEADALMRWRAQGLAHAQALSDAVKLRRRLAEAGRAIVEQDAVGEAGRTAPTARRREVMGRRAFMAAAAASVAGAAIVRPPLGLWPSLAELRADYRTRVGERRTVQVADGLAVELNTRTSLVRRDDARNYRLEHVDGEVAVDAADPARPVAIATSAGEAIGRRGRFSVRLLDAGACVACLAGSVKVVAHQQVTELSPGQQIVFDGQSRRDVLPVDLDRVEAWRRGLLVFSGQPLGEVVEEINRYRPGKIILAAGALKGFPITGTFQLARLDRAVAQIRQVANASVTSLPGGIVVLS